jgi:hypothetical protein
MTAQEEGSVKRHIDTKIEDAAAFADMLDEALAIEPNNEDLALIHLVIRGYIRDLQRVANKQRIDELCYYDLVRLQALSACLVEQMHEDGDELQNWIYGMDDNPHFQIANFLVDSLHQFTSSLTAGARAKNFNPLTPEMLTGILAKR